MLVLAVGSQARVYSGSDSELVSVIVPVTSATTGLCQLVSPWKLRTVLGLSGRYHSPLFELWVLHPVGEALPANTDAFQDSVASQLVHDQVGVHHACQEGGPGMQSVF